MVDFTTAQSLLAAARARRDAAQRAALEAAARARQAQSALELATRQQRRASDGLAAAAREASSTLASSTAALRDASAAVEQASAAFASFSLPQRGVGQLDGAAPFLLFPVRIETRFRVRPSSPQAAGAPAAAIPVPAHELLVRIYPDECSIDTFEPLMSQSELLNIKSYWMNIWRAGGVENDQRGAWAKLVLAKGAGRAGWLADNFQPLNLSAEPRKAKASDQVLVVATDTPLGAAEALALSAYWPAVWLADGDAARLDAANAALAAAVGASRAAGLIEAYAPFNLADRPAAPLAKGDVALSLAFLVLPPDPATTQGSWTQAPQVRQFPDRFVVLGFDGGTQTLEAVGSAVTLPLYTGPDPSADAATDPDSVIHPDGPDLFVPDPLKWMVDFDRAVAAGMALAIPLTAAQYRSGFSRLLVLGLQLSLPGADGPAALQELLAHHLWSRSGFFLLPQGTPAHNAAGASAGKSPEDDADASFDDRRDRPLFTTVGDPLQKRDGQWLADYLGLDPAFMAGVHGSDGKDQMHARAMQTALWPATLGYWMDTLFTPKPATASIFPDAVIDQTRDFFCGHVRGRGALPAIRIGGQPYGILPVTAFSRIQWFEPQRRLGSAAASSAYLGALYRLLRQVDADWAAMSQQAAWVGKAGDPHQTLLDIVGLMPSSVEYYSRNAESLEQLFNMFNRFALGPAWITALVNLDLQALAVALLQRLGYSGAAQPDLLSHFFLSDNPLISTVIDDRALSETDPVRAYTPDKRNYLQWLVDAAGQSLDALRQESGFTDGRSPQALLYLMLRHALMLGYYGCGYNFHRSAGFLTAPELLAMRSEPTFVHVAEAPAAASAAAAGIGTESRFGALYKTESRITGSPSLLVADYIRDQLHIAPEASLLATQIDALQLLVDASTAQLERAFAEHVDTCSYRYDAWLLGLVNQRIEAQLAAATPNPQAPPSPPAPDGSAAQPPASSSSSSSSSGSATRGLHLGAYAWVEDLHPAEDPLVPAQLPADLAAQFPGASPLTTDAGNGGFIHAPSIPHADAAAVLRAGFIAAKAGGGDTGELAVNLSSDRVRMALALIEGVRNGQSLGALLGYQFELGLHDDHGLAEVDKFIYPLRKSFPLVADALASTATDASVPIEAIEARNVLDGKKLADQIARSGVSSYPWGMPGLPAASPTQLLALDAEADALRAAYDAVADLALAEGVYQAVQGNYDRVASTVAAYTTGNFPPEPGIVDTAPAGTTLTHRVAIQFRPGLPAAPGATPRARAEPAIDDWLAGMLPPLGQIACTVAWTDPVGGASQQHAVTLADLGLHPIDALYLLKPDNLQAMAEIDDRIQRHVAETWSPRPDAVVQIQYMAAPAGRISIFESGPLLRALRSLLMSARALRASDVLRANDARQQDNAAVFVDAGRIDSPRADLGALAADIDAFSATTLGPALQDIVANRAQIIAQVDAWLDQGVVLLERAARLALPSAGWGFVYGWRSLAFKDLLAQVAALVARWKLKLQAFDDALLAYDNLPAASTDAERFAALQAAALIVSMSLDPLPASPALLRAALPSKAAALLARMGQFQAIQASTGPSFASLYAAAAALTTAEFDAAPFDVSAFGDRAIVIVQDLARAMAAQSASAAARIAAVDAQLAAAAASSSATEQASLLAAAAKALLGDDFLLVPEFAVSAAQGAEWANAVDEADSGAPFAYLKSTLGIDFPVDEWFYGAARVREPLRQWETALMVASAFGSKPPAFTAIQLPFAAGASWLGLEFPADTVLDGDRLLYTCLYTQPFDPTARQCGLLIDEWTETLPAATHDTGISFNYDRPDNEPAQSILMVVSPAASGPWQWADLVAALNETLDLAKKRAVEPAFLDPTAYARFLPATVSASTSYGITIAANFTMANGVMARLQGARNG